MIRSMEKAFSADSGGRSPPPSDLYDDGMGAHRRNSSEGPRPPTHKGFVGSSLTVIDDGKPPAQPMRVFLMNNSYYDVDIDESTIAGDVCLAMRKAVGIRADADCSLFSYTLGSYTVMQDDDLVLNRVHSWDLQDAEEGLSRLVYKMRIFIPEGNVESEAESAESPEDGAHRLSFIDAVHRTITGLYSVSLEKSAVLAALQLQSAVGDYDEATHGPSYISRTGIENYIAPALLDRFEDPGELESVIQEQHETLKGVSRLDAEQRYLKVLKGDVPYFGASFFATRVMMQETDADDDERTQPQPAIIAVSFNGIFLLSGWNLTEQEYFNYETITKWTVASNPDLFAFSIHDRMIYFCLCQQPENIETCVQMHISAIINARRGFQTPPSRDADEISVIKSQMPGKSRGNAVDSSSAPKEKVNKKNIQPPVPEIEPTSGKSSDSDLPEGWEAVPHRKTGKTYYWHEASGKTSWRHPGIAENAAKAEKKPTNRRRITKRRASALKNLSRRRASVTMVMTVSNAAEDKAKEQPELAVAEAQDTALVDEPEVEAEVEVEVEVAAEPELKREPIDEAPAAAAPVESAPKAFEPPLDSATSLESWLEDIRLVKYKDALEELGVESVEDLHDVTEEDLEPLGMKKLEIRRFNAGLKKLA